MKSIWYLTAGLICIFTLLIIIVAQPDVSTMVGIVFGGVTLALVPFILYAMRRVPKRDRKHSDSDLLK